jgi:hypothetical protein
VDPLDWLLLIHQVPAKPDYLRVKVGRRLARVGAVAVKAGVYALPAGEEHREDFGWILREVCDGGGEAQILEARLVDGLDDSALIERFRAARDEDAAAVADGLRALAEGDPTPEQEGDLTRLRRRLDEIAKLDFFGSSKVIEAQGWLARIDARRAPAADPAEARPPRGATWVTRAGIKVDRMASGWLIRRFVDPDATFRFVPARSHRPEPGEIRFDMVEAEFGHEGELCTFEVLVRRFGLSDPALGVLAELVHDVDCKDGRFGRPETAGFAMAVDAIAHAHSDDDARLDRASAWFDEIHAWLWRR